MRSFCGISYKVNIHILSYVYEVIHTSCSICIVIRGDTLACSICSVISGDTLACSMRSVISGDTLACSMRSVISGDTLG